MAIRPADDDDWAAMTGYQAPAEWFGFVEQEKSWLIDGMGTIYKGLDGRWWITFQRTPGVRKLKTAQAAAKRLLAEAESRGITVNGMPDPKICGSTVWMERLGFRRTDENIGGIDVWTR